MEEYRGTVTTFDPNGAFEGVENERLLDACGIIPMFFFTAIQEGPETAQELHSAMCREYGFGDYVWVGAEINENGTYVSEYEEDPDLEPYMSMVNGPLSLYIYQYGIIGVTGPDGTIVSRMD